MSVILTLSSIGIIVSLILITISFTEMFPPKWTFDIPVVVLIVSCIGLALVKTVDRVSIKNYQNHYQMKENKVGLIKETTMENKISIQRALTTIKLFENNFEVRDLFSSATIASKGLTVSGMPINEFEAKFKSDFDSIIDKTNYITDLRNRVQMSNMNSMIEVPQLGSMSIASVITYRQNTLPKLKQIVGHMTSQYNETVRKYEQAHAKWVSDFNEALTKANKDENTDSTFQAMVVEEIKKREPKIVFDKELHAKYYELIKFFEEELDIILSEHNASTFISLD